jgi:hypothetical protein
MNPQQVNPQDQPPVIPQPPEPSPVATTALSPATGTFQSPALSPSLNANDKQVLKNVRRAGVVGVFMGLALIGLTIGLSTNMIGILFGVSYLLISGFLVRSTNIKTLLNGLKILIIIIFIQLIFSIIAGGGIGFLPALILVFITSGTRDMYKAGYISSAALIKAQALR